MSLRGIPVEWCETIEYLGVYLESGSSVRFNVSPAKRAFYTAWNAIFLCSSGVNEIALLHLQETYSLSVLMYATPALNLTNRQVSELNACWNNVIQIVWLATTNGSQLALYYYGLADSMSDILSSCVK